MRLACSSRLRRSLTNVVLVSIIIWMYLEGWSRGRSDASLPPDGLPRPPVLAAVRGVTARGGAAVGATPGSVVGPVVGSVGLKTHGVPENSGRVIIVARYAEDTSWVDSYFGDVPHIVITPGLSSGVYTTPRNRGHETGPFLQYILANYDALPAHMAFVHGARISHHTFELDLVPVLKAIKWGAAPYLPLNVHMFHKVKAGNAEQPEFADIARAWPKLFTSLAPEMPREFDNWCCAQFAVTREAVLARPRAFYEALNEWATNSEVESFISSRVLEQTWHMIFGLPAQAALMPPCEVFDCDILDEWRAKLDFEEGPAMGRVPRCK